MRGNGRRGIILGVVVLSSIILGIFLFAYNYTVRRQNIRAHYEQIGEVASTLAKTGVSMFFEQISAGFDATVYSAAPTLVGSVLSTNNLTIDSSDVAGSICRKIRDDFDIYLSQLTYLSNGYSAATPRCVKMEIAFEDIAQVNPILPTDTAGQIRLRLLSGRDPVEKTGEAVVSCTVEFMNLRRKASIRRQFRVVSMIPGPFARFTLFVPYTPYANSYNSLGVFFNGQVDSAYSHPYPAPQHFMAPLKLVNGTAPYILGTIADARRDLGSRGWVFLGPAYDPPANTTGTVVLRIPSGYDSMAGGHFLFSQPKVQNGIEIINPELIPGAPPTLYNPLPNATTSVLIGGTYQGFYTNSHNSVGAATGINTTNQGVWSDLDPSRPWECAASWLMPYGDRINPSRTLLIGPVVAGFLKFYFLKDSAIPPTWGFIIKGKPELTYVATDVVSAADQPTPSTSPVSQDLFLPTGGEMKPGYKNFAKVMPCNFVPHSTGYPPSEGVAFNALFDFMEYGPGDYPLFHEGSRVMQDTVANPFLTPSFATMKTPVPPSTVKGIHPWESVKIKFDEVDGPQPQDNIYFDGDLTDFEFNDLNLLGRVTHVIDLGDTTSQADENQKFRDLMFSKTPAAMNPPGAGWWIPKKPGIFLVRRRPTAGASDKLRLPGKIFLDKSLIIIVDKGDVSIPDVIRSLPVPLNPGACPENLFTLVALDGNLYLGTNQEIHAYLVALKKPPMSGKTGGKLLSEAGVTSMNIFGGLAIAEMGLYPNDTVSTTMSNFPAGGTLKYNPRFNPSSPLYAVSRHFILEDKHSQIIVTGAD